MHKSTNLIRTFLVLVLLVSIACNRRNTAEYLPVSGRFQFSADLKLSNEELKADSVLNVMRSELLNRKGKNWLFFTSFAGNKDEILNEALYQVFRKMPKGGMLHIHATASGDARWIIANSKRSSSVENVISQIQRITRLNSEYPEMIVGFDLNGQEDGQHSNGYFSAALQTSPVPLILHAGESLSANITNIQDALSMNVPRIGHGVNLFYFPELENRMVSDKTMLEICPVSNQELRYVRDFRLHPALGYLQRGVQGTLGSDDPAFFQNKGLTDEYFITYLSWDLDLRSLKKMLLNSINKSGMPGSLVQYHLGLFRKNWDEFILLVNAQ